MDKKGTKPQPTLPLDHQKEQNAIIEGRNIFAVPKQSLFHYTSREIFWKIIEDESFLARHILFSNDFEEYELGREKVEEKLEENHFEGNIEEAEENERYMICFCEKGDLLSQWRGYAQNGISMEFDFSLGLYGQNEESGGNNVFSRYHCFTLVNNDTAMSKNADAKGDKFHKRYVSVEEGTKEKRIVLCVTAPYKVFYTDRDDNSSVLQNVMDELVSSGDVPVSTLVRLIPYIKNKKFDEEQEYRLIFDLADLLKIEDEWIRSEKIVYLDVGGVKKPNIRVEFGNVSDRKESSIKIYYKTDSYTDELKKFTNKLKMLKADPIDVELCLVSDIALRENEILVGSGQKQETIMRMLSNVIQNEEQVFKGTKIWCDGHLPLRKIIVGPSKDAELMKKSIVQYKRNTYWMKFVDVEMSRIPFRN